MNGVRDGLETVAWFVLLGMAVLSLLFLRQSWTSRDVVYTGLGRWVVSEVPLFGNLLAGVEWVAAGVALFGFFYYTVGERVR